MTATTHEFPGDLGAPLRARRWAMERLRAHRALTEQLIDDELIDDAVLCVSELVTNAVRAGCSRLRVELTLADAALRVAVIDDAPGLPTLRVAAPTERSGRGLRLVDALAAAWGVEPAGRGKAVWAELLRGP